MSILKDFAERITGKEYGYPQFTKEEIQFAKDNGIVVVYGASDDLMEFEGAIYAEGDCFDGGTVYFDRNGVSQDDAELSKSITALW